MATWTLFVLALAGCTNSDPIKVGVVLASDGIDGARLAAEAVNASGGIDGRQLELLIIQGSSGTAAREALIAADSLTRNPTVVAVVGHTNSSSSLAAAQVYNAAGMVQVAPTSTAPLFSSAGRYSFRMVPSDEHQAPFLVREILRGRKHPRTAVLYVNDDYGRSLRERVTAGLSASGAPPVLEASYIESDGFTDLEGLTRALERVRPTTIVWLGRGLELKRVFGYARLRLRGVEIVASDGIGSGCCTPDALPVLQGARYARMLDPTGSSPSLASLRERYRARAQLELSDQAAYSHDAVLLLAQAMRARGPNREAIREYLESLTGPAKSFQGATGAIWFDESGDPPPLYHLDTVPAPRTTLAREAAGKGNR